MNTEKKDEKFISVGTDGSDHEASCGVSVESMTQLAQGIAVGQLMFGRCNCKNCVGNIMRRFSVEAYRPFLDAMNSMSKGATHEWTEEQRASELYGYLSGLQLIGARVPGSDYDRLEPCMSPPELDFTVQSSVTLVHHYFLVRAKHPNESTEYYIEELRKFTQTSYDALEATIELVLDTLAVQADGTEPTKTTH